MEEASACIIRHLSDVNCIEQSESLDPALMLTNTREITQLAQSITKDPNNWTSGLTHIFCREVNEELTVDVVVKVTSTDICKSVRFNNVWKISHSSKLLTAIVASFYECARLDWVAMRLSGCRESQVFISQFPAVSTEPPTVSTITYLNKEKKFSSMINHHRQLPQGTSVAMQFDGDGGRLYVDNSKTYVAFANPDKVVKANGSGFVNFFQLNKLDADPFVGVPSEKITQVEAVNNLKEFVSIIMHSVQNEVNSSSHVGKLNSNYGF